ncbi:hypothetical protein HPB47_019551, partial [Ixodes persulcatus]
MLSNHFCFGLQVVTVLLGAQTGSLGCYRAAATAGWNRGLLTALPTREDRCIIDEPFFPYVTASPFDRSVVTSRHVDRRPAIRTPTTPFFTSELGSSTTGKMLRTPFCFVLQ